LLRAVQGTLVDAVRHRDYPFDRVIQDLSVTTNANRNPLFDVVVLVDSGWGDPALEVDGLQIRHLQKPKEHSKLDLTLTFKDSCAGLRASVEYSTEIFDSDRIDRMLQHFETLLTAAVENPDASVQTLRLLPARERERLLIEFNDTDADYQNDTLVHQLFEQQVQRVPDKVAIVGDQWALTFAQLNAKANALAWSLRDEHGVGPETLVGLLMERSLEMMIGILGILKAGGAYVPISIHDPVERIDSILLDSGSSVVLTRGRPSEALRREGRVILDLSSSEPFTRRDDNPPVLGAPGNLIYCIYTSGSTGKPKGVLIEHRAVVNRLQWMIEALGLDQTDVILQKTPHVFDVSVWELLLPGLIGARQVLLRAGGESDPGAIRDAIRQHRVSTIHFVPSMLSHYLETFEDGLRGVRRCICSGEALDKNLAKRFFAATNDSSPELYNYYGPTEATVDVSFRRIEDDLEPISIGRPAPNNTFYILDAADNLCPIGVTGELCVGGVQVGRGYLNRPALTRECFTANPFRSGERMYRTGDLARWRTNGEVLYLGRRDRQVKVRGFRIELGEIEQVLCTQAGVERAVVVSQRDDTGMDFLCAYVQGLSCPAPDQMRAYLASRLPAYMIPSHYVHTNSIPTTRNGKVDRDALVRSDLARIDTRQYLAPRTQIETELIGIWQALLPVGRLGINDDFFLVGGNSLSALQLSSRIKRRFGISIGAASIFTYRTVADLARLIADSQGIPSRTWPVIRACPRSTRHVLSFAQERIWFLHMLNPQSTAYNMPALARLKGPLNLNALEQAIHGLVKRHEMLRVTFVNSGERAFQVPHPDLSIALETRDLSGMPDGDARENVRREVREASARIFRLHEEPPFRSILFRLNDTEHHLLIVLHHIAGDGWSLRLLLRELSTLYMQHLGEPIAALPPLPVQYIDYAEAMRHPDHQDTIDRDLHYWRDRLADCPSLALPVDFPGNGVYGTANGRVCATVSPVTCRKLKEVAHKTETTLFEIIMSALNLMLSRLSDQQDVVIGFPVANRHSVELEGVVGLFLNTLVLRTDLSGRSVFSELLRRVSAGLREALEHQAAPFELLVEKLNPARHLDRTPVFSVLLNFLGDLHEEISIRDVLVEFDDVSEHEAKFPLTFYVRQAGQGLEFELVYRPDLFSAPRAQMMARQLKYVLEQVAEAPNDPISSYSLIPPGVDCILPDLDCPIPEPEYPPVTDLIADRALSLRDRVAIAQGTDRITYTELVNRSEAIAQYLVCQGFGLGDVIAVTGPRGIGFVVSLLGVFRSGAIVFPLDARLPKERRRQLMTIGNAKMLIRIEGEGGSPADPKAFNVPTLGVAARTGLLLSASLATASQTVLSPISGKSPAYLFFTSGTTGSPRGVLGRHGALSHFLLWQSQAFGINQYDRCAQLTNPSFDVMLRDTFLALVSGGTVVVPEELDETGGKAIFGWLLRERITVLHAVPTVLQSWLLDAPDGSRLPFLRWTFLAGEPLKGSLVESFRSKCPDSGEIVNLYGPTETTLAKFAFHVPQGPLPPVLPVGSPLPYCQALVMRDDVPCGVGELGEIIIRTPFRTLGYFNDPVASQAAFYPNPHRDDDRDLLYRTGDIGRFRPDGMLEVLGRKDQQLKISGVRVEPAEIEDNLGRHPSVQACLVVAHQDLRDEETHLVAYVIAREENQFLADDLRAYLSGLLPLPMVPREYLFVDQIPTTPNGKPDRKALPKPRFTRDEMRRPCEAPRNDVERSILKLWCAIFQRTEIGVRENFFEIGGTSLKLLRLFAFLEEHFPGKFRVAQLFTNPTIAMQAALVDSANVNSKDEVIEIEF
jgi:amino acid adenylation domain-containing protein